MQFVACAIPCTSSKDHAILCTVYSQSVRKLLPRELKPVLESGPLSPTYEIKDAPGKGRGLFAKYDIQMGEAIVVERPMLVFPNMEHASGMETATRRSLLMQLLGKLSKEDISLLSALSNCRPAYPDALGAIFSNAITIALPGGSRDHHAALFPTASLINHRYEDWSYPIL
jgi:hypothetical protein